MKDAEHKLKEAYIESSNWWHTNIGPKLPIEIQKKLLACETFDHIFEGDRYKIVINNEEIDITNYVHDVPIKTIFEFYKH
jgi:hypothetical protein